MIKNEQEDALRFLALGDSYTIGESIPEKERWPVQLIEKAEEKLNIRFAPVEIIATTGWTTDELKDGIAKVSPSKDAYDLVSLLIGVNNQYRGYSISDYEQEFEELLISAISYAKTSGKVIVLSIPDYGKTPFAQEKEPDKISEEVASFNRVNRKITDRYKVPYFDITPISQKASNDISYVAKDQLHPSGKMYDEWSDLVLSWMKSESNQ